MWTIYERREDDGVRDYKALVLALLQQCKDEGLTVSQTQFALKAALHHIELRVMDVPLMI